MLCIMGCTEENEAEWRKAENTEAFSLEEAVTLSKNKKQSFDKN